MKRVKLNQPFRRLLVTGYCRCGTTYLAKCFQEVGLDIQHERVGADGCVSCMFFVDVEKYETLEGKIIHPNERLSSFRWGTVLHQTRHPLKCIASQEKGYSKMHKAWLSKHGIVDESVKPNLLHAMKLWVAVTGRVDKMAQEQFRIEDIEEYWPRLLRLIGAPKVELPELRKDMNRGTGFRKPRDLTWDDLSQQAPALADKIMKKARRYGYKV